MFGHHSTHGLRLRVREGKVDRLRDLTLGVGDDDACLFFDRRVPLGIVGDHVGAVAQQSKQRMGDGWLAGAVTTDEPTHHREVFRKPPPRNDYRRPAFVSNDVVSQRTLRERTKDH